MESTVEHRCDYCSDVIPDSWLAGDYSLLCCHKKECLAAMNEVADIVWNIQFGKNNKV